MGGRMGGWTGGDASTKEARRVLRPALHGRGSAGSRDGLVRRHERAANWADLLLGQRALSARARAAHQHVRALATAQLGRRLGDFRWHVCVCGAWVGRVCVCVLARKLQIQAANCAPKNPAL